MGSLIVTLALFFVSCSEKDATVGVSVSPEADHVFVCADTFPVVTKNKLVDYIYCNSDTLLLGNYSTETYGITVADIFTQFAMLEDYSFPPGAEMDSMLLLVYYKNWYGYSNAAMDVTVYEMDLGTFDYSKSYQSNISVNDYCTMTELVAHKMISAMHPTDSVLNSITNTYTPVVRMNVDEQWAEKIFDIVKKYNSDQDEFNEHFNGLYITSQLGTATMLYVHQIELQIFYHYEYQQADGTKQVYSDIKVLPANNEVRTLNRFSHPNQQEVFAKINENKEFNYVASPSNFFTEITLPIDEIVDKISSDIPSNKEVFVNGAILRVDVVKTETDVPSNQMLLIRSDAVDRFFKNNEVVLDTCAIVATLSTGMNTNDSTFYYYAYDLMPMLMYLYRNDAELNTEYLDLTLIPVMVETPATGISSVKHLNTMSATKIYSGTNKTNPMTLKVLYSGF